MSLFVGLFNVYFLFFAFFYLLPVYLCYLFVAPVAFSCIYTLEAILNDNCPTICQLSEKSEGVKTGVFADGSEAWFRKELLCELKMGRGNILKVVRPLDMAG